MEQSLVNFEQQIAALEAKARQFEERIYGINQPQPHTYRLVRARSR